MVSPESLRIMMVMESTFPSRGGGGAENQLRTLSRHLVDRGHRVSVMAPMTPLAAQRRHDEVDGVPLERIPYPKVRLLGGLVMLVRFAWRLYRRRNEYDVIHAHIAHRMSAVACVVGRMLGKPVLVKLTGWLEKEHGILSSRRTPAVFLMRRAIRRATAIQATSEELKALLAAKGFAPQQVHYIPNAVDMERFSPPPVAGPDGDEGFTAVYVGRLVPEKNLSMLIDAWAEAFPPSSAARLLIAGKGPLQQALEHQVMAVGRSGQIEILGPQPRERIADLLRQADVGLLVSTHEGLSNSLLEYMAAGLPVIGSRISGTVDLVQDGVNGWLFDSGDRQALCDLLRRAAVLPRRERLALGREGRRRVRELASIESVTDRILQAYGIERPAAGPSDLGRAA